MSSRKIALALATMVGGSVAVTALPVAAQTAAPAPQRSFNLSKAEKKAIDPLLTANTAADTARKAGQTPDWAAVRALLPAAEAAANSNDARYLLGRVQLSLALGANDLAAQERVLTALLANASTPADERSIYRTAMNQIVEKRAEAAFAANDFATAERIYRELIQTNPSDTRLQNNLRIVQTRSGNTAGALQSVAEQIRTAEASGGIAGEQLYRTAFETYYRAQQRPQALTALGTLIRNYPTPANLQNGIAFVRERAGSDRVLLIDTLRFARAANMLRTSDYLPLAVELDLAGLPGETLAVIDAGAAAGAPRDARFAQLRSTNERRSGEDRRGLNQQIAQARSAANGRSARLVGDLLYGYGRYAEAADLYRVALRKGGEDAGLVNTRLGAALALAGNRAEAEAAFRAVTGSRAELAQLWLAWLGRRSA
ncbi:tetratricopeptide repeat protein [Tsuneonella sp. HG249]